MRYAGDDPKFYRSGTWRNLRRKVFIRDCFKCQHCGSRADHVDHILPRKRGGDDTLDNLQALCRRCHSLKTRLENPDKCKRKPSSRAKTWSDLVADAIGD